MSDPKKYYEEEFKGYGMPEWEDLEHDLRCVVIGSMNNPQSKMVAIHAFRFFKKVFMRLERLKVQNS